MFGVKEIDAAELKDMMDSDENIQLLDVRSQEEFAQGFIEGGELVPLHTIPLKVNDLSKDKTIVIYCRSGARSAQACMFLSQNTDIEAINLRGGIISWSQAGFDVARTDEKQEQG